MSGKSQNTCSQAHEVKGEYEKKALKKIFGDLLGDSWGET